MDDAASIAPTEGSWPSASVCDELLTLLRGTTCFFRAVLFMRIFFIFIFLRTVFILRILNFYKYVFFIYCFLFLKNKNIKNMLNLFIFNKLKIRTQ